MFKLILVVIILVTVAYMWNSSRIPGKNKKFKFNEDPLKDGTPVRRPDRPHRRLIRAA